MLNMNTKIYLLKCGAVGTHGGPYFQNLHRCFLSETFNYYIDLACRFKVFRMVIFLIDRLELTL